MGGCVDEMGGIIEMRGCRDGNVVEMEGAVVGVHIYTIKTTFFY